jgi:hypothetical protein
MMNKAKRLGFWTGGVSSYLRELRVEKKEKLDPLRKALKREKDPEIRGNLKRKIKSIKAEYRQLKKNASTSLFGKN